MKRFLLLFLIIGMNTACSTDDDDLGSNDEITTANITLKDASGNTVSGMVIYAYNESTWQIMGDDPQFADFQSASGNNGISTFSNLTTNLTFNSLSNYLQTFRFSVRYELNGVKKVKVKAISFDLGDNKTDTIILN